MHESFIAEGERLSRGQTSFRLTRGGLDLRELSLGDRLDRAADSRSGRGAMFKRPDTNYDNLAQPSRLFFKSSDADPIFLKKARFLEAHFRQPIHEAIASESDVRIVELLLRYGFPVNGTDSRGETPLHVASRRGEIAILHLLLRYGADVSARCFDSRSPLDEAARNGHTQAVWLLLSCGADANSADPTGYTALHWAARTSRNESLSLLLAAGAQANAQDVRALAPLHVTCLMSNYQGTLALLEHGASPSVRAANGWTPLHVACCFLRGSSAELVDLLLKRGADEAAVDKDQRTPGDVMGIREQEIPAETLERVRLLVQRAPQDRAWRRRRLILLCRARVRRGRPADAVPNRNRKRRRLGGVDDTWEGEPAPNAGGTAAGAGRGAGKRRVTTRHGLEAEGCVAWKLITLAPEEMFRSVVQFL